MKNSHADQEPRTPRGWKDGVKSALLFCLYYSGLERLLARLIPAEAVAILMYHGVCDRSAVPAHINFHLGRRLFERQMRILKQRYRVMPLAEVVAALSRGGRIGKAVVLTFDDGYQNNARYAAPVLEKLGFPFTIFVVTANVDAGSWLPLNTIYWLWSAGRLTTAEMNDLRDQVRSRPWHEVRERFETVIHQHSVAATQEAEDSFDMLSWDQIRNMADRGVEFGSHTHDHCNMRVEDVSQQHTELAMSKDLLEAHLRRPVFCFAYPYGRTEHMSETSREQVIAAGYKCALSTEQGLVTCQSDPFRLPRLGYDARIWMFAGEILYRFLQAAARDQLARLMGRALSGQAKESHG
ncbi:MAG TPA: polysaccharide deacetylase family protein [Bryobacteraceae bacterium]|nr:polysaccharide deacetylase family protein [Bryobacteraceae bacterium]